MKNKSRGITLIALVITIIVLLILAGITIATLTGENGLLNRASSSKVESDKAREKEQVNLAVMTAKVNENGAINKKTLKEELNKIDGMTGVPEETQEFPWTFIGKTGEQYEINEKGLYNNEKVTFHLYCDDGYNEAIDDAFTVKKGTTWGEFIKNNIPYKRIQFYYVGKEYHFMGWDKDWNENWKKNKNGLIGVDNRANYYNKAYLSILLDKDGEPTSMYDQIKETNYYCYPGEATVPEGLKYKETDFFSYGEYLYQAYDRRVCRTIIL